MPARPRLHRLRQTTAPLHRALEAHPVNAALVEAGVTVLDYARFLLSMHLFWSRYPPGSEDAQVLRLLHDDLGSLSLQFPEVTGGGAPCNGIPDRLAREYLMAGSSLGGAMILKHLQRTFGREWAKRHARFVARGCERASAQWPAFLHRLESVPLTRAQEQATCDCAVQLFRALLACCDEVQREGSVLRSPSPCAALSRSFALSGTESSRGSEREQLAEPGSF